MKTGFLQEAMPAIVSLTTGILVFISGRVLLGKQSIRQEDSIRKRMIESYSTSRETTVAKARMQTLATKNALETLGNRLVKDQYASRLRQMLVTSGDWEKKNYSGLVRRKLFFAIGGFLFTFLLLLMNNISAAPLVMVICISLYFLPNISHTFRKIFGKRYAGKLEHMLDRAGKWTESGYIELVKRKLIFATSGFIISYLYLLVNSRSFTGLMNSMIAVLVGFFLPDLLLQNKVLKRKEIIANTLPDSLDILQMCVGAGLAFPAALARVAESQSGPIAEEFARVTTEVQLGKSRSEALAAMAERTQEKSVEKFVNAMQQVTTFGIPVLNVIVEQAKEMRMTRREKARERAQKVPVKILGPIMVFFLPSVLIIVIGPAAISIMKSLG